MNRESELMTALPKLLAGRFEIGNEKHEHFRCFLYLVLVLNSTKRYASNIVLDRGMGKHDVGGCPGSVYLYQSIADG